MYDNPAGTTAEPQRTYVAPRTDVERELAAMWRELLDVSQVGVHDSFLKLGGESLLATQAAARIAQRFGCRVSMRTILLGTIAAIAGHITATAGGREPA